MAFGLWFVFVCLFCSIEQWLKTWTLHPASLQSDAGPVVVVVAAAVWTG